MKAIQNKTINRIYNDVTRTIERCVIYNNTHIDHGFKDVKLVRIMVDITLPNEVLLTVIVSSPYRLYDETVEVILFTALLDYGYEDNQISIIVAPPVFNQEEV